MTDPTHHSLIEDVQGIGFGICMAAVGMHVLTFMGFVAGQTTGVAALIAELDRVPRDTRKASAAAKSRHAQTPDVGNCPAF